MKERSAERKAWVKIVEIVGLLVSGLDIEDRAVKAGGVKRRK